MIQDDYGNLVPSGKTATFYERLAEGDARMARIESDVATLRNDLHALRGQLPELLAFFEAMKGAFKVLNWLGKLARPMAYIVGLGISLVGLWTATRGHR